MSSRQRRYVVREARLTRLTHHLRLKGARSQGVRGIPVILCEEWTAAQIFAQPEGFSPPGESLGDVGGS
jgi:hypothetical protein